MLQVLCLQATLVLQKTQLFQRAIFFSLLNPQPDGSCFAMMKIDGKFDFSGYKGFQILFKSQSASLQNWKLTLDTDASTDRFSTYEQQFEVQPWHFTYILLLNKYFVCRSTLSKYEKS